MDLLDELVETLAKMQIEMSPQWTGEIRSKKDGKVYTFVMSAASADKAKELAIAQYGPGAVVLWVKKV